jgi:hypothetical protein
VSGRRRRRIIRRTGPSSRADMDRFWLELFGPGLPDIKVMCEVPDCDGSCGQFHIWDSP